MEFIKYYPDNPDFSSVSGHEFMGGVEHGGFITEAWYVRDKSGLVSVMYELGRNMIDIVFDSEDYGHFHIQAGFITSRTGKSRRIEIIKREPMTDMPVLNEFKEATGLPTHIQILIDKAFAPEPNKLDRWQKF